MLLSFEKIKEISFGAVSIKSDRDGIRFRKCTDKQIQAWNNLNSVLGDNARTTTGIRLDFHTDSKKIGFYLSSGKYELYINNVFALQRIIGEQGNLDIYVPEFSKEKLNRVTLYFPSHSDGVLKSMQLDDDAFVVPHQFRRKLLFIGDSITQGWNSRYDSLSFANRISRFFDADCVINGVGGGIYLENTFDKILYDPDAVIIAYGTNDFHYYETYEDFTLQVNKYLAAISAEYLEKPVFVLTPVWRGDKENGSKMGNFDECRAIIHRLAQEKGLIPVDGSVLMPPIPDFFADGFLHPNDNGFSVYAENLIPIIMEKANF